MVFLLRPRGMAAALHSAQSMSFDQIAIPILGALAAWCSQERRESWRRWACIFGIVGQPFWFYASWKAEQWGIFAGSVLYGAAWLRGSRRQDRTQALRAITGIAWKSELLSVAAQPSPQ